MSNSHSPSDPAATPPALDLPASLDQLDLLAALFHSSNDCVKILDLEGRLLFMSEGGLRVMEVDDPGRIIGCFWPDVWKDEGQSAAREALAAARRGTASRFLGRANTLAGTPKYWDVQVVPIPRQGPSPTHILSISRDITELRAADGEISRLADEARASELSFRTLADAMPQMVWSTLPDGYHDYYNARWYEFTGTPPGSTDGEGWSSMFHPDDQAAAWQLWRESLRTGNPYEVEYRLRHHSGEYRWVLGRALPVRDSNGAILRWHGTCTDIHETKQYAENLAVLGNELSHRIKNIFAIITGLIGIAAVRFPECRDFANDIKGRLMALGRAHDLAWPRHEVAGLPAEVATLHSLLREILGPYLALEDGRIRLSGDDLPVTATATTPLALIFHELATNASKYGALSVSNGLIHVSTVVTETTCIIEWHETGGPTVSGPPTHEGFGTRLTALSAENQLGGKLVRHWLPTGLNVTLACPRETIVAS